MTSNNFCLLSDLHFTVVIMKPQFMTSRYYSYISHETASLAARVDLWWLSSFPASCKLLWYCWLPEQCTVAVLCLHVTNCLILSVCQLACLKLNWLTQILLIVLFQFVLHFHEWWQMLDTPYKYDFQCIKPKTLIKSLYGPDTPSWWLAIRLFVPSDCSI